MVSVRHVSCRIMDCLYFGVILPFNLESVPSQEFEINRISLDPSLSFVCLFALLKHRALLSQELLWFVLFCGPLSSLPSTKVWPLLVFLQLA